MVKPGNVGVGVRDWGQVLEDIQLAFAEAYYAYAEPIIYSAAEWIREKSLAGFHWVKDLFQRLWQGEFSSLSVSEIVFLIVIMMVLIAGLYRAVRLLFREQQPFKVKQRRRPWRKLWKVLLIPICVYAAAHYLVPEWGENRKPPYAAPVESPAPNFNLLGTVVKVKDGDSIIVRRDQDAIIEVRLHGIDAPEYKQAHGKRARRVLASLVSGEAVGLVVKDIDRFGRAVAVVYVDGKNVNLEMVCAGHAWWYQRYAAENIDMKKCQHRARSSGLGLWAERKPVPPWEWRR